MRVFLPVLLTAALLPLGPGVAHAVADYESARGLVTFVLRLDWAQAADPAAAAAAVADRSERITAGGRARLLYGGDAGPLAGLDFVAGNELDGAFIYGLDLDLLGWGRRFSRGGFIGVTAGAGVSGVVDHAPVAFEAPVEAILEVDLDPRIRALLWARRTWTFAADPRADELAAGCWLRLGKRSDWGGSSWGGGYVFGLTYQRQQGAELIGVTLGFGISIASDR